MVVPGTEPVKKKSKNHVQKDEVGNIIYPIVISSSLRLVAPGSRFSLTFSRGETWTKLPL